MQTKLIDNENNINPLMRRRMLGSIPGRCSICVRQLYSFLYSPVCGVFLVTLPFGARVVVKTLNPVISTGGFAEFNGK
jgi:hypothetical protein